MTWSIGMRAPSVADLFQNLGEWLASTGDEGGRYRDPDLTAVPQLGQIDTAAITRFKELLLSPARDDEQFCSFLGSFLSRYRLAHEPAGPENPLDHPALVKGLESGRKLKHNPWTRLLWVETSDGARLFAAGDEYQCSSGFALTLCDPELLSQLDPELQDVEIDLLCELLNRGHLYIEEL